MACAMLIRDVKRHGRWQLSSACPNTRDSKGANEPMLSFPKKGIKRVRCMVDIDNDICCKKPDEMEKWKENCLKAMGYVNPDPK